MMGAGQPLFGFLPGATLYFVISCLDPGPRRACGATGH